MNLSRQISTLPYGLSLLLNILIYKSKSIIRHIIDFVAYSNYFYGLCVLLASYETIRQLNLDISDANYYVFIFVATTLFYLYPYINTSELSSNNSRVKWYREHKLFMRLNLIFLISLLLISSIMIAYNYSSEILNLSITKYFLIAIFPIIGICYYNSYLIFGKRNLRSIVWLKPFIIGIVWAGICNVYPIIFSDITHNTNSPLSIINIILFLKTTLYVSILAIIFDIKDMAEDNDYNMQTLVLKYGLEKTISRIVIPLTIFSMLIFLPFAILQHFSFERVLLISIPFLSIMAISKFCNYERSLLFYLLIIDGLIIYKAILDIGACYL